MHKFLNTFILVFPQDFKTFTQLFAATAYINVQNKIEKSIPDYKLIYKGPFLYKYF